MMMLQLPLVALGAALVAAQSSAPPSSANIKTDPGVAGPPLEIVHLYNGCAQ